MRCTRSKATLVASILAAMLVVAGRARAQQQVGHKTLGTLGLQAGSQAPVGLYLIDQFAYYHSSELVDRNGHALPIGLEVDALANGLGVSGALEVPRIATYVNASVSVPLVSLDASTQNPRVSVRPKGVGDLFVQPLKLGWRPGPLEVVAGYAFYAPTASFDTEGSTDQGRGQWTHEFSLGGTLHFGPGKRLNLSALTSFDIYGTKLGIDLRRGDTLQVQGGFGAVVFGLVNIGAAGYALWQVTDYGGSALGAELRGARDVAYGVGPEMDLAVPPLLGQLTLRYVHDVADRTRPVGDIVVVGWVARVWGRGRP
ncbi:MAG TPA: transporter [Polyangiaceae bacterium]|nr:transporter [Polyangiaceae bacterium]